MVATPNDLQARNAAIPSELKKARQWARWKPSDERKNPCNLDGTWMEWKQKPESKLSFEEVARYPHIETFITLESGIIGIDFDGCIDENGEIHPLVKNWLCSTYAEISPSGTGIKMWGRGKTPSNAAVINDKVPWGIPGEHTGIEVYADKRPFTVTGNIVPNCPSEINDIQEILDDIVARFTPAKKGPKKGYWTLTEWKTWVNQHLEVIEEYTDCFDIVCPWKDQHTTPGESMRIWYGPPHAVNCFHSHCKHRTWEDLHPKQDQWTNYSPGQDHSPNGNGGKKADTSAIDKAIEDHDVEAIYKNAHVFAHMERDEYAIFKKRIKDSFGKEINLNELDIIVKDTRKKAAMDARAELPGTSLDALADDFEEQYADTWAYNALTSIWYQWSKTHWQDMQDVEAQKRSCVSLDRIVRDLMLAKDMTIDKISDLDGVVRLACIHCKRTFRQKSNLVNFKNGTLDIDTGKLRAHDKADELTYCLPYAYDEHGEWPTICAFLTKLFPDVYARQNFMVHIGLSLIGDVKMHFACALIGAPRTGKSKGLDLANLTCGVEEGRYSGKTLFDVELEGKRTRFAQNKKRIVCVDELPAESLRNEENFKNMTAHSGVEMRGICKDDELNNRWTPKIFMAMNERPEYKDTTGAIKERLVPLLVGETIAKEIRDIHMADRFKPELGGFAASCIRLAKSALKIGYYPLSGLMKQAINTMAMANNPLKSFIDELYIVDLSAPIMFTSELYKEYKEYCAESGNKPLGKAKMSSELVEMRKGITHKRERNPFNDNKVERGLLGVRHRRDTDPIVEDENNGSDSMLVVDDVDDMLTILFQRRQQDKTASEEASDTIVDDVDDDLVNNAHIDTPTPFQKTDTAQESNTDIQRGRGIPIEGNRSKVSSTSSTNPVGEPVKPFEGVDDTFSASSTRRQHRQQKSSIPSWLIPGTSDWSKLVERVGLKEANDRRQSALQEERKAGS